MTSLLTAAFGVGVAVGIANLAALVASALGVSDYWPAGERGWNFYVHWGASQALNASILAVAYLGSLEIPALPRLVPGAVLFVAGFTIAIAAALDLGVEETKGLEGELRTGGWYRYSRNPQYVGYVAATVGGMVLATHAYVDALLAIYLCWWLTLPFAEEPWLYEQYGEDYERYADRVPRFVGGETVRALAGREAASAE